VKFSGVSCREQIRQVVHNGDHEWAELGRQCAIGGTGRSKAEELGEIGPEDLGRRNDE
tara:strand:- start:417 stop:590 length:174 start_codon:yes stop_codon:yes gene_type:complete